MRDGVPGEIIDALNMQTVFADKLAWVLPSAVSDFEGTGLSDPELLLSTLYSEVFIDLETTPSVLTGVGRFPVLHV